MIYYGNELYHHGIIGQKWGLRRYQNLDGSYKSGAEGRYGNWTKGSGTSMKETESTKNSSSSKKESTKNSKSTSDIAKEVIRGNWGNGEERKKRLKEAGYDYKTVQDEVNRMLKSGESSSSNSKSNSEKSKSTDINDDISAQRDKINSLAKKSNKLREQIAAETDPKKKAELQAQLDKTSAEYQKNREEYNEKVSKAAKEGTLKSVSETENKKSEQTKIEVKKPQDLSKDDEKYDVQSKATHQEWINKTAKEKGWSSSDAEAINSAYDKAYDLNAKRVKLYNQMQNETDEKKRKQMASECNKLEEQENQAFSDARDVHQRVAASTSAKQGTSKSVSKTENKKSEQTSKKKSEQTNNDLDYSKASDNFTKVVKNEKKNGTGSIKTDDASMREYCKKSGIDYDKLSDKEKKYYKDCAKTYNKNGKSANDAANALIKEVNKSGKSYNELYPIDSTKDNTEYAALDMALTENTGLRLDYYTDAEKAQILKKVKASQSAKHCYYVAGGNELYHHGIIGQKWGIRRYQNKDGTLTAEGQRKYLNSDGSFNKAGKKFEAKLEKKDTKWADKNYEKITSKAYKQSKKELKPYSKELSKNPMARTSINEYNRHMAEIMNTKVTDLRSPSGKVVKFVAKRGELGVHMGLATSGYDMSQVKNGVWASGRIAYNKKSVGMI